MRHIISASALLIAGVVAIPALAGTKVGDFDISGTGALASNYVSRGLTNSDKHPSIQGAATVTHSPSGLYATISALSVDLQQANNANLELDYAGGWAHEIPGGLKLDLGMIHYSYPGVVSTLELDYNEYYLGAAYKYGILGLSAKYSYSDDFGGINTARPNNKSAYYLEGAATVDLPYQFVAAAHWGYTGGDHFEGTGLPESYNDFSAGVSREVLGFGVDLSIYGTDQDGRKLNGANSDDQIVMKVSKAF